MNNPVKKITACPMAGGSRWLPNGLSNERAYIQKCLYGITGGLEKSVLWWSLCIHVAIWGFQARTKDMTMIAENPWSHSRDILQLRVEQIPRSEDGTKSCFCGHSNQADTVRTRHSLLHKRVWQIVCDGIKEGGGKIPRGGEDRIEKFHVTLLPLTQPITTLWCIKCFTNCLRCYPEGGGSIEKFQPHPPHYFSWLFPPEICHVILIHIRSNRCTSFLELGRMDISKNAKHSQVILIKGRGWVLSKMPNSAGISPRPSLNDGNSSALKGLSGPHLESDWNNYKKAGVGGSGGN